MPGSVRRSHANSACPGTTPKNTPPDTSTPTFSVGVTRPSGWGTNSSSSSSSSDTSSPAIRRDAFTECTRSESDECICVPRTRIRKQHTPRETRCSACQSRSQPLGSPIRHALTSPRRGARNFEPSSAPASSSATNASTRSPASCSPDSITAAAANTIAATAPFMSLAPRP